MLQEIIISFFLFSAVYFEVFMLLTLFEHRKSLSPTPLVNTQDKSLPTVTIVVPCFNEQNTIQRTVTSLLQLDYPKNKLSISIVDDGSTDSTWEKIQTLQNNPQIEIFKKENGGKYTALNYGITKATTDLVGCLDADSFVSSDALRKMVQKFQDNTEVMAIAPAVKIWKPNNMIRSVQYVEYTYGIFIKKIFSMLGAIHVTPGPFSIFRRKVFAEIGLFKHAHNTEDMEIALRMHRHSKKIENCHDAFVYTVGPDTFRKLHTQRLRWTYGFLRNSIDYKDLFFNKKNGNIGFLTLPFSVISLVGVVIALILSIFIGAQNLSASIQRWSVVGFHPRLPSFNFDFFFAPINGFTLITTLSLVIAISMLIGAQRIAQGNICLRDFTFYMALYPFIAATWIVRSFYNLVFMKSTSWR